MDDAREKIAEAMVRKKLNPQTNMGPPAPPKERSWMEALKDEFFPDDKPKGPPRGVVRG